MSKPKSKVTSEGWEKRFDKLFVNTSYGKSEVGGSLEVAGEDAKKIKSFIQEEIDSAVKKGER